MLDRAALRDVAAATYRGARTGRTERLDALDRLAVTLSRDVLVLRPIG
jgi:hypothetical protein